MRYTIFIFVFLLTSCFSSYTTNFTNTVTADEQLFDKLNSGSVVMYITNENKLLNVSDDNESKENHAKLINKFKKQFKYKIPYSKVSLGKKEIPVEKIGQIGSNHKQRIKDFVKSHDNDFVIIIPFLSSLHSNKAVSDFYSGQDAFGKPYSYTKTGTKHNITLTVDIYKVKSGKLILSFDQTQEGSDDLYLLFKATVEHICNGGIKGNK